MAAASAARAVIGARLRAVEGLVHALSAERNPNPASVHRLRVATRRADAALRAFRPLLGRKRMKRVRNLLRRYRRGAAEARRADVQAAFLRSIRGAATGARAGLLDDVLEWLDRTAGESRADLRRVVRKRPAAQLEKARKRLLSRLEIPSRKGRGKHKSNGKPPTFAELGMPTVRRLVEQLDATHGSNGGLIQDLHAHRLRGKRLRYALEVFAPCFSTEVDAVYQRVRDMQDDLGAINDLREHADMLERFVKGHPQLPVEARGAAAILAHEWRHDRDDRAHAFVAGWRGAAALCAALLAETDHVTPVVGVIPGVSENLPGSAADAKGMQRVEPRT